MARWCGAMDRLRGRDLGLLLSVLQELMSLDALDSFPHHALDVLDRLVPSDNSAYNEIDVARQRAFVVSRPMDAVPPGAAEFFAEHASENPLVSYIQTTGDSSPVKFSAFISQRELHERPLYQLVYRRMGVEHQLAVPLAGSPIIGINFNRDICDFSDRDRLMLDVLRPFLRQAHRVSAAFAQMAGALDLEGRAAIVLSSDGAPLAVTERARQLLRRYFEPGTGEPLPEPLERWVRQQQQAWAGRDDVPPAPPPLVVEQDHGRLCVQFVPECERRTGSLLLLEEQPRDAASLSRREREVLEQLILGQSNAEVGVALQISRRTVEGHLQRLYAKLGVANRTAAVAQALRRR
jgi:DNA-binding CsgD family transcriptional regulator